MQPSYEKPKATKKKAEKGGIYEGIPYESDEELGFLQWAFEIKSVGYITDIERAGSYNLSPNMNIEYELEMKTKKALKTQTILKRHIYTPEFIIKWQDSDNPFIHELGKLTKCNRPLMAQRRDGGELVSIIEVKPMFDQNNMERLFKINQKWMWAQHGLFVNLVKPQRLFEDTFTPQQFLLTRTGKSRTIKWEIKTFFEFLKAA